MKLIIDIPEEDYKRIIKYQNVSGCGNMLTNSIIDGTPLYDVKTEIEHMGELRYIGEPFISKYDVLSVIDKHIGKAEKEGINDRTISDRKM